MVACYLAINSLIFVSAYLLNRKRSTFLPMQLFSKPFSLNIFFANSIRRYNFDMFRFAGDLALLIVLTMLLKNVVPLSFLKAVISIYVLFAIIHQTYYHSIKYVYNTEPLFINDFILIKRGIGLAFHGFKVWFFIGIIFIIIIICIIIELCSVFVNNIYFSSGFNFLFLTFLVSIVFCSFYSIDRYTTFKSVYGFLCFIMPTVKFYENVRASFQQKEKLQQLKQLSFEKLNESNRLNLTTKKNIFFIGVESYGSLIFDASKFFNFTKTVEQFDVALLKEGWKVASAYSESPISGGASWLSYSTLLKGMHIDSESTYSFLFSDEKHLTYKPFMQRLQNNGYDTFFLSSIGGYEKLKIPWQKTLKFLGLKNLIKYNGLSYTGKHFGFGPSPPDQYSLHKAFELIKEQSKNNPFAMFWLTLNSHYPWDSPEETVDDWKMLNQKQDIYWIDNELSLKIKYEKAMIYQLQVLVDFILKKGTEDDVFILVGDHQPFHIAEIENTNTPVHIITKDERFVTAFESYGFINNLASLNSSTVNLKHAGIQSLLIKNLNKVYGNSTVTTYYKNGINEF